MPVVDFSGLMSPVAPLGHLAEQLDRIGQKLQDQQNENDISDMIGRYNGATKTLYDEIPNQYRDDPWGWSKKFTDLAKGVQEEISGGAKNRVVAAEFQKHVSRNLPTQIATMKHNSFEYIKELHIATIKSKLDNLTTEAAETSDNVVRDLKLKEGIDAIDRATSRGYFKPSTAQELKRTTRNQMLEKNMDFLGRENPPLFYDRLLKGMFSEVDPNARQKIVEEVHQREERKDRKADENFRGAQRIVKEDFEAQANFGAIPESVLNEGMMGKHPILADPAVWRNLKTINDNPPTAAKGSLPVEIIMEDYYSRPSNQKNIDQARIQLNAYRSNSTGPDPYMSEALKKLQTDERTMLGIENVKTNNAVTRASDDFKGEETVVLPGFIGQMMKAQKASDLAEIRNLVRRGVPEKDAVEQVRKKRETINNKEPASRKNIQELLRK